MPGETDLATMLAALTVLREPGTFVVATLPHGASVPPVARAWVREREGTTVVLEKDTATELAVPFTFEAAWLTLTVHSSLDAVGLTAWFARRLADAGIPANVLAGFHHDHILVPVDRADEAISVLDAQPRT